MAERRPSFQFYPADFVSNANLRRCTFEQQGVWVQVMCLLHGAETYGILRWPLNEIGQAVGCKVSILEALVEKGVMKGADPGSECHAFTFTPRHAGQDGAPVVLIPAQPGPLWYSSRMVKDEYIRRNKGKSSRFRAKGACDDDIDF